MHQMYSCLGQAEDAQRWAMTRGLATPAQAKSIIDEYRRRHAETGDAYPWWSLQPGYPDHLGYFHREYCRQGGYANGGLMPWVGGELCRAAFLYGREEYGVELLRAYAKHLRHKGGAQVWYWPNGEPGFRTTNEVPYAGWGMAEWVNAALGGLAGIHDENGQLRAVTLSPNWAVTPVKDAFASVRYAASRAYFAYRLRLDKRRGEIRLDFTGSGEHMKVRMLLPGGWKPKTVSNNGKPCKFKIDEQEASRRLCFSTCLSEVRSILIACDIR